MTFEITKMKNKHIEQIAEIEAQCFTLPWSKDGLVSELNNNRAVFLVAVDGEEVLAYMGMHNVLGEGYVTNVAVSPLYRRKGIARALIESQIAFANENQMLFISLEVRVSNDAAISLYEAKGFKRMGIRKNFYEKPVEDAVIMTYYINGDKV